MPLEVRFLHNPESTDAFFGTALGSALYHVYFDVLSEKYQLEKSVQILSKQVTNWTMSEMPGLVTDLIISMDDRHLFLSCWLHGDIRQYDISDPFKVSLIGQIFVGGSIHTGTKVKVINDSELTTQPQELKVKEVPIQGGPQMLQLSLDGKRMYVTNSLYSTWDEQFYPQMTKFGSAMLQINVDTEKGGLHLNKDFLVDFGSILDGPFLAHEMRYPGGDCTSDIWI